MTWAVIHGDASWTDLDLLIAEERIAVDDILSEWVTSGPPQERSRTVAGVTLFEHDLQGGVTVSYFIDDGQRIVGLLRIRPRKPPAPRR